MTTTRKPVCPCDPQRSYTDCCAPFHRGTPAPTPETLMRSRYSAYVLQLADYLLATWHPETRPATLDLSDSPKWRRLAVLSASCKDHQGQVHYRAFYATARGAARLEEIAEFVQWQDRWYYLKGQIID